MKIRPLADARAGKAGFLLVKLQDGCYLGFVRIELNLQKRKNTDEPLNPVSQIERRGFLFYKFKISGLISQQAKRHQTPGGEGGGMGIGSGMLQAGDAGTVASYARSKYSFIVSVLR